jgi:hypothetical protein
MLPVSLDYPFLIAPSVFSNVYLSIIGIATTCGCKLDNITSSQCPFSHIRFLLDLILFKD